MAEMHSTRRVSYYLKYILLYSVLFAVVTAGVFLVLLVQDKSFVWYSDAVAQYVPRAAYFGKKTREILAGFLDGNFSIPTYDFTLGMGNTITVHLEPLYWLFLLFDASDVEFAYTFILLARFYVAGLSMSAFLMYFKKGWTAALIGSFSYIYCGYGMWACMRHAHFLYGLIMLPLCILAVEEIYQNNRWWLCTLVVWIHLWCGYYFFYINTIATGVYFLIRFFGNRGRRTWREFWKLAGMIIGSYLLGVLIGNATLVDSFASYLTSGRTEAVEYGSSTNFLSYGWKWPINFLRDFLTAGRGPGNWLRLGYIPLIYIGLVVLFLRKGRKTVKASVITGTIFCMIPAVAFVFSGFSNINNRWSYVYSFALSVALAFVIEDICELTKKERLIVVLASLPFLALFAAEVLFAHGKNRYIALVSGFVMVLTLAVLLFLWRKPGKTRLAGGALVGLTVVSLWCYGLETFAPRMGNYTDEFPQAGTVVDSITNMPLAAIEDVEDDTFYRAATRQTYRQIQGAAQFLDYNGTVWYSSTTSRIMQDFWSQMGVCTWSGVRLLGFNGRSFLDTLACVKYYALLKDTAYDLPYGYTKMLETEKNGKTYEVFENEMALPIGYTYDTVITEDELLSYEVPERQEVLMQAASLDSTENGADFETTAADGAVQITGRTAEITEKICESVTLEEGRITIQASEDEEASLTLKFDGTADSEVYLYIKGLRYEEGYSTSFSYSCGEYKSSYSLHGVENPYYSGQKAYLFNLGYHKEAAGECKITFSDKDTLKFDDIQIFCQPMGNMSSYTDHLKENSLENVEVLTNCVRGTISLEERKLLVFSVPYQNGWTAYVDGQETEIQKANLMYMGIWLEPGEHTIELRYRMPGMRIGVCVSVIAFAVFLFLLLAARRRRRACKAAMDFE